jgi:hypothetical protein
LSITGDSVAFYYRRRLPLLPLPLPPLPLLPLPPLLVVVPLPLPEPVEVPGLPAVELEAWDTPAVRSSLVA